MLTGTRSGYFRRILSPSARRFSNGHSSLYWNFIFTASLFFRSVAKKYFVFIYVVCLDIPWCDAHFIDFFVLAFFPICKRNLFFIENVIITNYYEINNLTILYFAIGFLFIFCYTKCVAWCLLFVRRSSTCVMLLCTANNLFCSNFSCLYVVVFFCSSSFIRHSAVVCTVFRAIVEYLGTKYSKLRSNSKLCGIANEH